MSTFGGDSSIFGPDDPFQSAKPDPAEPCAQNNSIGLGSDQSLTLITQIQDTMVIDARGPSPEYREAGGNWGSGEVSEQLILHCEAQPK